MSIIDWIFVIGVALTIVGLLLSGYSFVRFFLTRKQLKQLPTKRMKNKKKQRMIARKRQELAKKTKGFILRFFFFLLMSGLFAGATAYLSYYQSMNLTTEDSNSVVNGYYLLRDFSDQLEMAKNKSDDEEKIKKNLIYLSTSMASYGTKKASNVNSEEGQLTLNRFYNSIKQLGMNATTQVKNFYGNAEVVDSFMEDIKKAQLYEKAAFEYYKVDESTFSQQE